MARGSGHDVYSSANGLQNLLANDHDSAHGHTHRQHRDGHASNGALVGFSQPPARPIATGGGPLSDTSSGEQADGDDSDADAAEADEKDDADEDEVDSDAFAPSGGANKYLGTQTGHTTIEGENTGVQTQVRDKSGRHGLTPKGTRSAQRMIATQSVDCDTDDDAYDGVDDISESGDEGLIINEREGEESGVPSKETLTYPEGSGDPSKLWEDIEMDGLYMQDVPYFVDQLGRTDGGILDSEIELYQLTSVFDGFDEMPTLPPIPPQPARRVHFREPVFVPSDSSDIVSDDEDLNGLFKPYSGQGFNARSSPVFEGHDNNPNNEDGSSVGKSSGYETDYDETEQEDVPASATKSPQALLRQPSPSSLAAGAHVTQVMPCAGPPSMLSPFFKVSSTRNRSRRGPPMGSFEWDLTKPGAMINNTGSKLMVFPTGRNAGAYGIFRQAVGSETSTANASPTTPSLALPTALHSNEVDYNELSTQGAVDPMLAFGSESMADILLPTKPAGQSQTQSGPSKSEFLTMSGIGGVSSLCVDDSQDGDSNDFEDMINIDDFVNWGDETSDEDPPAPSSSLPTSNSASPIGMSASAQSKTPSPSSSAASELLAHFDKGVINAFRQGQSQHQQQPHRPHTGLSLNRHAFKSGRHAPVVPPIPSAPKKRKLSGGFAPNGSFGPSAKKRLTDHR